MILCKFYAFLIKNLSWRDFNADITLQKSFIQWLSHENKYLQLEKKEIKKLIALDYINLLITYGMLKLVIN